MQISKMNTVVTTILAPGLVSEIGLAIATARLNSCPRFSGLSSRELWTERNQFTHEQLLFSNSQVILAKHELRSSNHAFSESKNPRRLVPNSPPLQVGDLVYLVSDKDKSRARDRYIVVSTDPPWWFVKKFSGCQLRASSYKIKLFECFPVHPSVVVSNHPRQGRGAFICNSCSTLHPSTANAVPHQRHQSLPPCLLMMSSPLSWPVLIQRLMSPSIPRLPPSSLSSRAPVLLLLTNHRVPPHVHLRNLLAQDLKDRADLLRT